MDRVRGSSLVFALSLLAMLTAASGCATDFEKRLAEAERLRAQAAAAGSEWLETESLLNQAVEEADRDNMDAAFQLLDKARFQAETAIAQAQHEADAWAGRVVK